jgi:hypothetical protein
MRTSCLSVGLLGSFVLGAATPLTLSATTIPTAATQTMLSEHPGLRAMVQGRGVVARMALPSPISFAPSTYVFPSASRSSSRGSCMSG